MIYVIANSVNSIQIDGTNLPVQDIQDKIMLMMDKVYMQ